MEIYALLDPRNSQPRYVGQSRNARKRLGWHINAAKRGVPGYIYNWLRSILRASETPALTVLETCSETDADAREVFWIAQKRTEGAKLTNCTEGGGGTRGWAHSAEAKARIGDAHRGKTLSPETLQRLSASLRGRKLTPEHKAKLARAGKGRQVSPETRRRAALAKLGNQHPLGCKRSPETLAKMRAAAASGGQSPKAKVSDEQATEIRRLFAGGFRQCDLARMFGVDPICVHRIVRSKTYK